MSLRALPHRRGGGGGGGRSFDPASERTRGTEKDFQSFSATKGKETKASPSRPKSKDPTNPVDSGAENTAANTNPEDSGAENTAGNTTPAEAGNNSTSTSTRPPHHLCHNPPPPTCTRMPARTPPGTRTRASTTSRKWTAAKTGYWAKERRRSLRATRRRARTIQRKAERNSRGPRREERRGDTAHRPIPPSRCPPLKTLQPHPRSGCPKTR